MKIAPVAAVAVCAALLAAPAIAQWGWRDASGQVIFSDQPPPAGVRDSQIIRRPSASAIRVAPSPLPEPAKPSDGKPAEAAKPAAPLSLADREAQFQKRIAERAEAEKKAAEETRRNEENSAACARLRNSLAALDSGQRVARYNDKGETIVLDDAARAAESSRMRRQLEEHCR